MRSINIKPRLNERGAGLVVVLVLIAFLLILLGTILTKLENDMASGNITYRNLQALNLAEAGVEKAIYELNRTNGAYTGEKNSNLGAGKFTVTVKSVQGGYKLTSIGETRSAKRYTGKKVITAIIQHNSAGHWKIVSWQEN